MHPAALSNVLSMYSCMPSSHLCHSPLYSYVAPAPAPWNYLFPYVNFGSHAIELWLGQLGSCHPLHVHHPHLCLYIKSCAELIIQVLSHGYISLLMP